MIGVILWSSPAKEKAVIWCEDHGALAYLQGKENLVVTTEWPEAGDLVELEFEVQAGLRHARFVCLVAGNQRSELPGLLREMGEKPDQTRPLLRVISNPEGEMLERPLKLAAAR
ncbi:MULTISPECIES: hypothetical protein [Paracoccus]|jgi:hypothetical protein|uniref:Uncharacterized protein n=1 Tax=Paracoccus denitrificans (strain Pd 1222) TaxID=318586 RepID=A1B419_PARDP|nr:MULTISPECIES: hypothetical protein [Paracoccus]ABL70263.1 hypothetical protein Pden_2171 [Paracoccus denitrificans PD1222]MBB4627171.1 hypothetical protein [Paracoccus denitrificans]MCU7428056.1 hypothetical protein [Paracoccus denitrificans]MDK8873983.1 hypothetical protein [Paracoccus sp. SSJ]QAR25614.1 hypothetical protein EO213_04520 [Paracoccus denitrificans]